MEPGATVVVVEAAAGRKLPDAGGLRAARHGAHGHSASARTAHSMSSSALRKRSDASLVRKVPCARLRPVLANLQEVFLGTKLAVLFPAVPLAIAAQCAHFGQVWVFALSLLGLIPLAERVSFLTEQIALYTGPTVGGLLNATCGNATELIIALFALMQGKIEVVKCSLLGSVLSNLLLVLGTSLFCGGIVNLHADQPYDRETIGREHGAPHSGRALPVAAADAALRGGLRRALRGRGHHGPGALPRVQHRHAARLRRLPLLPAQDAQPALRAAGGRGRRRARGGGGHRVRQRALLACVQDRAHRHPVRVRRRHDRACLAILGSVSELHQHHPAPNRRQRGGARRGHHFCTQEQAGHHSRSSFGVGNPDLHVCGTTECHCCLDRGNTNGSRLQAARDWLSVRFCNSDSIHPPGWNFTLSEGDPSPPVLHCHRRMLFRYEATSKSCKQQRCRAGSTNRYLERAGGITDQQSCVNK